MATDKFDYTAQFINGIRAKIVALQAILASVDSAAAIGALGEAVEGIAQSQSVASANGELGMPIDLPKGAFNGKSLPACVELYLSSAKRKKTIKEIAAALREGGVESTSDNFENVVTGALFRLRNAGKVLRFKDGWGLPEWYPANIRGAAAAPAKKQSSKKRKKRQTRDAETVAIDQEAQAKHPKSVPSHLAISTQDRIIELLQSKPNAEFSSPQIVSALPDVKPNVVNLLLGRLTDRKKAERTASGNYRIASTNLHQMASAG